MSFYTFLLNPFLILSTLLFSFLFNWGPILNYSFKSLLILCNHWFCLILFMFKYLINCLLFLFIFVFDLFKFLNKFCSFLLTVFIYFYLLLDCTKKFGCWIRIRNSHSCVTTTRWWQSSLIETILLSFVKNNWWRTSHFSFLIIKVAKCFWHLISSRFLWTLEFKVGIKHSFALLQKISAYFFWQLPQDTIYRHSIVIVWLSEGCILLIVASLWWKQFVSHGFDILSQLFDLEFSSHVVVLVFVLSHLCNIVIF